MDYKELAENLAFDAKEYSRYPRIRKDLYGAANSITDLLARAEAAEKRAQAAAQALLRVQRVLYDPLIIQQEIDGKPTLRPVKNTSRQDVYRTILLAQKAAQIPYRWFPVWVKGGEPDDSDD